MANKQSAKSELRKNVKRRAQNRAVKTRARTSIVMADRAIVNVATSGLGAAVEALRRCTSYCMRASKTGVLTKGAVARKISRLTIKLKKAIAVENA